MAITAPLAGPRGAAKASISLDAGETVLRLIGAALIALVMAVFIVGTAWDIQWHPSVGRDRVLTSPHIVLLSGIALSGLLSLSVILLESWRAWRGRGVGDRNSTTILGIFRAPIGVFAAGVGALTATLAFPLDDYWHTLYGIDVTLWAPFHIEYQVTAVPGTTVNAVPVKALLAPDPDRPGAVRGTVNLPVSGQWMLTVDVIGPSGRGDADVPILAGAPPAMPEWLGWLIGLLPAWLIIGFVIWQARRSVAQRDGDGATMTKSIA